MRLARFASTVWLTCVCLASASWTELARADVNEARELLRTGKYRECLTELGVPGGDAWAQEDPWRLKIEAHLATGEYDEAQSTLTAALKQHRFSVQLRLIGHEVYRRGGQPKLARQQLDEIVEQVGRTPWRYSDGDNRVAVGRTALLLGDDARQVLEVFFDKAKEDHPELLSPYLASGQLALDKHDYKVAAEAFEAGLKKHPKDPELLYGLARAYASSDDKKATAALQAALDENPRHIPSLLFSVDNDIDRERYVEAVAKLDRVQQIDPRRAEAWAYRSVLGEFAHRLGADARTHDCANCHAPPEAAIDSLIGRKLSQHYRFLEGSIYQRRALATDPNYLPAKIQLSQDLLRLGKDVEGWKLAAEVNERDGYDVVAFNLVTLRDHMAKFRTLETPDFWVRMDAREAAIYGPRVLELLTRAKKTLCQKYGLELNDRITVEIFPEQKDFAIRTFGIPGGAGFLGVCFGKVVTANSPASQAGQFSNWEAVLWHEFCHVVTLETTRNRMPRWLSEGISVYEELQQNPSWGQRMTPRYREFVLGGQLTPVSKLSGAFMNAPSPLHVQFAYYESCLVVEFYIQKLGIESLKRLLLDVGAGMPINEALARHTGSLEKFEADFAAFAKERAEKLAPGLEWEREKLPALAAREAATAKAFLKDNPKNFWGQLALGAALVREKNWAEAQPHLEQLIAAYPAYVSDGNAYELLAAVHRAQGATAAERKTLTELAARDAEDLSSNQRLCELAAGERDWAAVEQAAQRMLAVNPLVAAPHRWLAQAAEERKANDVAIAAWRAILQLESHDAAETHYRLARLLHAQQDPAARRHVLMALEEAPRYREALELLLKLPRPAADATKTN